MGGRDSQMVLDPTSGLCYRCNRKEGEEKPHRDGGTRALREVLGRERVVVWGLDPPHPTLFSWHKLIPLCTKDTSSQHPCTPPQRSSSWVPPCCSSRHLVRLQSPAVLEPQHHPLPRALAQDSFFPQTLCQPSILPTTSLNLSLHSSPTPPPACPHMAPRMLYAWR